MRRHLCGVEFIKGIIGFFLALGLATRAGPIGARTNAGEDESPYDATSYFHQNDVIAPESDTVKEITAVAIMNNKGSNHLMFEKTLRTNKNQDVNFILNIPHTCANSSVVFLLIAVCSAVSNLDLRQAIRDTWLQSGSGETRVIFLVGQTNDDKLQASVVHESRLYNDIIQIDVPDSYHTLTLKSVAMLQWIHSFCSHAKFVLKCDDDIFINIPLLTADLRNTRQSEFIMGQIIAGAEPIRDKLSKWYTPETVYADARYPEYVSGCAYVISGDILAALYASTKRTPFYWIEDVYITAMCAANVGASHVFNGKFGYKLREPCVIKNVITSHRLSADVMRKAWVDYQQQSDIEC